MGIDAAGETQGYESIVVYLHTRTAAFTLRVNLYRLAKEDKGLVDQMTAKIIKQASSFIGITQLTPGIAAWNRPVTLETRFKARDRPQQIQVSVQERTYCPKIIVPAPVVKHREELTSLFTGVKQPLGLGNRGRHRLIDHDRQSVLKGRQAQRHMQPVRGCDYHQIIARRVPPERICCRIKRYFGKITERLDTAFRIIGHNGRYLHSGRAVNQRRVEDRPGQPIPDNRYSQGFLIGETLIGKWHRVPYLRSVFF